MPPRSATSILDVPSLSIADVFDIDGTYQELISTIPRDNRQGVFHPSGVGRCGRANVYEYRGEPCHPFTTPDSIEYFDLGHAIHELVGKRLGDLSRILSPKNIGYSFRREVPFDPAWDKLFVDLGIAGTTDGLLEFWADDWRQRSILEIKSANKDGFDTLSKPKLEHVMQAHIYAYRFDCPIMYIWYYGKNNSQRKIYPVLFDHAIMAAALAKFEGWLQHFEAGTLPPREEDYYKCPRCEYRGSCQPGVLYKIQNKNNEKKATNLRQRGRL